MDKVIILFDRDIDDIHFIIEVFAKMRKERVIVRTKIDQFREYMSKSVRDQLVIDTIEAKRYDNFYGEVIGCGFGKDDDIRKQID